MGEFWSRADWERTWFRTQSRPWRTLAIVPAETGTSEPAFGMAKLVVGLGAQHDEKLGLADFRTIPLRRVSAFLQLAEFHLTAGERLVYATASIVENPATITVARAADCVLLCVSLGTTSIRSVEDAIDQIGRERFLGSVVFRPPNKGKAAPSTALTVQPADDVQVRS